MTFMSREAAGRGGGGVQIGHFCMDGIPGRLAGANNYQADGKWTPWTYKFVNRKGSSARLYIFDRAVPPEPALLPCSEIALKAQANGVHLLLAGTVNTLNLNARVFTSTTGGESKFQIDANQFRAELGRVLSGDEKIGGGSMNLAGARLYVTNRTRVLALSTGLTGIMEIEAWNRRIEGATFVIPGGARFKCTLDPLDPAHENVMIRLDLATASSTLWSGHLRATSPQVIDAPSISTGTIRLTDAKLTFGNTYLTAEAGSIAAHLNNVTGSAGTATLSRPTVITTLNTPVVGWTRADSTATQSSEAFTLGELSLADMDINSDSGEVHSGQGALLLSGHVRSHLVSVTTTSITGNSKWQHPSAPALAFVFPKDAISTIDITFLGPLDAPHFHGSLAGSQIAIGPIGIAHSLTIPFDTSVEGDRLRIPIHLAIGSVGAGFVLHDQDQNAAITASLTSATIDGTLVIRWREVARCYLEIPAGQLDLHLATTVAAKPILAGTVPSFGSAAVHIINATTVSAGDHTEGTLRMDAAALALGQPILRVGPKGKESPSTLALTATGNASAVIDLPTGKLRLSKAAFLAHSLDFKLLDPTGSLDLAGIVVQSPHATLDELSITIDEEANPRIHRADLGKLAIESPRVYQPRTPEQSHAISFEAVPTQPIIIGAVHADGAAVSDAVDLQAITISDLASSFQNVEAQFGDGFGLHAGTLTLNAHSIASTPSDPTDAYAIDNASFTASGRLSTSGQLHINGDTPFAVTLTASGRANHLNGTGSAHLGPITGSLVTTAPMVLACTLSLPVEYNFATGDTDLTVTASDGVFAGEGSIAPVALALHSTSGASCNTDPEEDVISPEHKASMTGLCFDKFPPYTCEWSTTVQKVALRWHKHFHIEVLAATALLSNPRLSLRGQRLRVCNLGAVAIAAPPGGALVAGGVEPQIDTNVPLADKIINPAIATVLGGFESSAATALANVFGSVGSLVMSVDGNLICLQQ